MLRAASKVNNAQITRHFLINHFTKEEGSQGAGENLNVQVDSHYEFHLFFPPCNFSDFFFQYTNNSCQRHEGKKCLCWECFLCWFKTSPSSPTSWGCRSKTTSILQCFAMPNTLPTHHAAYCLHLSLDWKKEVSSEWKRKWGGEEDGGLDYQPITLV